MEELQIFNFEDSQIRTLAINDEPWFVGKDVAVVLGYSNPQKAIRDHVDEEDRTVNDSFTVNGTKGVLVNESGLYSLIISSKLPTAKKFKRWVTSEVLPAIRKHGAYAVDQLLDDPDLAIKAFTALKEERAKRKALESKTLVQAQQIQELQPKASYYDVVLNCKDLISIGQIAKDFGKSAKWMNNFLHQKGVQYKQGSIWLLYAKYQDKGYTSTKTQTYAGRDGETHCKVHTYWTQQGRLFIYELMKAEGIKPMIEREGNTNGRNNER